MKLEMKGRRNDVRRHSGTWKAGLRTGDELLALNGTPCSSMSKVAVGRVMDSSPGFLNLLVTRRVPAEAETFRDVVDMMPKQNEVTELGGGINSDHILKDEDLDKCAESQHLAVVDTNIKVSAGAEGIESNICLKFPVSAEASRKTAEDLHASIDSPQHLDLSNSGVEEPEQLVSILQEHVEERKECEHSSMRQNIQKKIVNQNMRERECILNFSVLDSKGKEDKLMEARAQKVDLDLPENRDPKSKQFDSEDCDTSAPSGDKKACGHLQGRGCVEEAPHRVNLAGSSSSTAMEATENSRHIWEVAESERRELDTKPVVGEGNKENFWENGVVVDRVQASESERQMQECVVVESTVFTGRPVHSVPVENPICPTKESPARNYQETATKAKLNRSENSSEKQVKEAKSRCKTIASLLTASPNPNSRGVLMFKKRRQRAKKFTLTSFGNIEKVACAGATEGTDEESLPTTSESELEEEDIKERREADRSKFESIRSVPEIVPHLVTEAKLESDFGNLEDTAMMVQQNLEKTQMCNGTTEAQSDEWVFYGIDASGAAVLNNAEQAQTRTAEMESPQLQQIHPQISQHSQCKETHEEGNQQVTVGKTPHSNAMTLPCSDYKSTRFQAYGLGTLSNVTLKAPLSCTSTTGGIKCIPALQVLNRTARPFTPGVAQEPAGTPLSPLSQRSKQIQAMQPQSHGKGFLSEQATQNSERICNNSIPGTVSTKVQNAKTTSSKHCTSQKPAAPIQTNVELQVQPLASAVRMHHPATPLQKHTHEALSTSQDVPRTIKVDSGIKEPQQTQRSSSHPICPSSVSKSILTSSLNRNVFPDGDDKPAMITSLHLSDSPSPQKDPTSDGSTVTPFSPEPPPEISSREQRIIIPAACTGILQEVKKRNARQPDKTKMFTFKEVQKNSPNPELLSLVQNLDDKGKGLDVEHEDDSLGLGAEAANFSQVHKANKSPPPVAPKPVTMTHQDSPKIYNSHSTSVSPGTAHNCAPAIGSPLAQSVAENYTFGTTTRVGPSLAKKITPPPSPSVLSCRIAEMKGKGAELFVKRQNRMERFVVGNIPEDLMVNGRGPSPTPSLPASWKYSSQIRAPPPICYNPILSPFYPPAAAAKSTQGGGMTMTATRPPGKGKGGSKCKMEKMEIMKHQPYQLNSAMFTYSSKNTAKVKAVPQMPASTQPVAEPCRSYSNVHQKPPVSVTSQLQMEVRGVPASQNVNSESAVIILPQKQQDRQSAVPVQSPSSIQKQTHFGHLQNQSQRSVPCITTRQGPVTAIVSPVKATTTDERQLGRVGPTPFLVGLDHSARQSPSLYQAPRPTFSAKASGVKPHVWQPQAGQP